MKSTPYVTLPTVFLFAFLPMARAQSSPDTDTPPEITVTYAETAPEIDGVVDDAVWKEAPVISDFVQRLPNEGDRPTEGSSMQIAYDEHNLYFAFIFSDGEPSKIRANNMERGGRNDRDDFMWLMLDTYHDRRNAYLFESNVLGTQDDAIITDESLTLSDFQWDGIFSSKGRIDDKGWTLEMAIPFRTIRFSKDAEPEMGLAVQRWINRKNETSIWPFIPLKYKAGISQVSQYATLKGMKNIKRGRNIEIKPYIISGSQELLVDGKIESDFTRDAGVDIKYGLTSNLTLDLTLNTDFAQVESDNVQLDLTRFSLFFPEKREFFLERSGLFSFGDSRTTETFFSRRIGISNDILAGARLTGQAGPFSVGLLNIQTEKDKTLDLAATNNTVARVRADVFPRTTVGAIFTDIEQGDTFNRATGVDLSTRFWGSSSLDGWFTRVSDSNDDFDDAAGSISLRLQNDLYGSGFTYRNVGKRFSPALGFVRRRDMIEYSGFATYSPRFGGDALFQQVTVVTRASVITGQDNRKQSSDLGLDTHLSFQRRDRIDFSFSRQFERLTSPFFIRSETEIPIGNYNTNQLILGGVTDNSRRLFGNASLRLGQFFNGDRTIINGGFGYRFSKFIKIEGGLNHSIFRLPGPNGDFDATTLSLTVKGATSKKLFGNALIQYDNFSRDLQANIRIDWIHTPGSDLFFVFNTSYNFTGADDRFDVRSATLLDRVGVAKVTYVVQL